MINKKNKNKLLVAALVFLSFLLDVSPSIKLCRGFCLRSSSCQLKDRRHRFNKITNNMSLKTHVSGLCNLMTADIYTRTCARGLSWVGAILSCEVTACHEPIRMTLRGGATKLMEGGGGSIKHVCSRLLSPLTKSDEAEWVMSHLCVWIRTRHSTHLFPSGRPGTVLSTWPRRCRSGYEPTGKEEEHSSAGL